MEQAAAAPSKHADYTRRNPNHNKDASAWLHGRKKGGVWRRGRKVYKRGERSGTSGTRKRVVDMTEEARAQHDAIKEAAKKLRAKHSAWHCRFTKIMSGKSIQMDLHNDITFEDRVAMLGFLCTQDSNVASAAVRTVPEPTETTERGAHRECDVFMLLHEKRTIGDMKKDFTGTRIKHAEWEVADPKEWKGLGPGYRILRDATPASKQDAKLLMAALTGEGAETGGSSRSGKRKRPSADGSEEAREYNPGVKHHKTSSGRWATALDGPQVQPMRGKANFAKGMRSGTRPPRRPIS